MEIRSTNGALIIPSGLIESRCVYTVDTLPSPAFVRESTLAYTTDHGWMHMKGGTWRTGGEANEALIEQQLLDWMASRDVPIDGKSAYELAQDNGFVGSLSAWLLSLRGTDGTTPSTFSWANLTGVPGSFPPSAHTHTFDSLTSKPTTLAGFGITDGAVASSVTTALSSLANSISVAGYSGSYSDLSSKPTIPAAQVNADWNAVSGVAQISNKPTTLAGFGITDSVTAAALSSTLSGYATTSALTSGLAAKFDTPAGTTAQYVRGNGTLATLPVVAARSFSNPTRAFNTAVQLSATRDVKVTYYVDIRVQSLLLGNARGNVFLDYADDTGMATNLVTMGPATSSISGVLSLDNISTVTLSAIIPAGKYSRIRTAVASGTASFTMQPGQEVLL